MNERPFVPLQRVIGVLLTIGGLWHAAAPWLFQYSDVRPAVVSSLIAGLALAAVGVGIAVTRGNPWLYWAGGVIAVWVLVAPQVLGVTRPALMPLEATWGGPMALLLIVLAALDRMFSRSLGYTTPGRA